MRLRLPALPTLALAACLSLSTTGCIKAILADGQIKSTREGAGAADTLGDYEVARAASSAGLMQFEGMHRLRPNNPDALFLLLKGWAGYGFAFAQDDMEVAQLQNDDERAEYHKRRAKLAFDRSVSYGVELVGKYAEGFEEAKKTQRGLKAWLDEHFDDKADGDVLYWLASAWMARVNLMKEDPDLVAELYIGVTILEHANKLNPEYANYGALNNLASYHARASMAELDEAQKLFEEALAKTQRKTLMVQLNYATRYACNKGDKPLFDKLINEVLSSEDPDPNQRLVNTIAKRRAKRALAKANLQDCAFNN